MHPKIYPQQNRPTSNNQSQIGGPIGGWANDEAAAVFTFVMSQVVGQNSVAIAVGKSDIYYPGGPADWWAPAEVLPNSPAFRNGGATVMAWASIALKEGGWRMYPWGLPVDLS